MPFFIAALVAVGLYFVITVHRKAVYPSDYGRKAMAYLVAITTILPSTLPLALNVKAGNHFANGIAAWLTLLVIFGGAAYLAGWLYGKAKFDPSSESVRPADASFGVLLAKLGRSQSERLKRNTGAQIMVVYEKSPAFYSNLLVGDVIIAIDGKPALDCEIANSILNSGDIPQVIRVIRDEQEADVPIVYLASMASVAEEPQELNDSRRDALASLEAQYERREISYTEFMRKSKELDG